MSHTQEKSNRNVHDQDVQLAAATLVSYFTVEFLSGGESEHVVSPSPYFPGTR